eukprot:SAG22_NODE_361_length_11712_cov_6.108155_7_plen_128_part_00
MASSCDKIFRNTPMYPTFLWIRTGILTYLSDIWNLIEFVSYTCFLVSFWAKIRMTNEAQTLYDNLPGVLASGSTIDLDRFAGLQSFYMIMLAPNCILMWIKLFKFIDVVPQLGLLINVLSAAGGPVC